MNFEEDITKRVLDKLEVNAAESNKYAVFTLNFTFPLVYHYSMPQPYPGYEGVRDMVVNGIIEELKQKFSSLRINSIRTAVDVDKLLFNFSVCGVQ